MKFGDTIIVVASLTLGFFLFDCLFNLALVPTTSSDWGALVAVILSILASGLVVGYVFADKLREESERASIGIVVLFAVVIGSLVMIVYAAIYHYGPMVDEHLQSMYDDSTFTTNTIWFAYELMALTINTAMFVVFALVFGFIGLYVGSMLKPSASTKE